MTEQPTNRIVVDVQPFQVPFLGGADAPALMVELADGERIPLVFPDSKMYGVIGLNMFMQVLQEEDVQAVEQTLLRRGIITPKEES